MGVALAGPLAGLAGTTLGAGASLGLGRLLLLRSRRRQAILSRPFPGKSRRALTRHSAHYRRLPAELRARFEADVRLFLAEKRITGVDAVVTDELRLLVAASAVTLTVGWPTFEWDRLTEVLLYPKPFDRDYGFETPELAGMAHPSGEVILSIPTLRKSFADPEDGYHSGYHEFAHLLDLEVGPSGMVFDGLPVGVSGAGAERWEGLARREMERVRRGTSLLDGYAATNPVEFFAVAVETFFERPVMLRAQHRELYTMLASYFRQDPSAWESGSAGTDMEPRPRPARLRRDRAARLEEDVGGIIGGASILTISILILLVWLWLGHWHWGKLLHPRTAILIVMALAGLIAFVISFHGWLMMRRLGRLRKRRPPVTHHRRSSERSGS